MEKNPADNQIIKIIDDFFECKIDCILAIRMIDKISYLSSIANEGLIMDIKGLDSSTDHLYINNTDDLTIEFRKKNAREITEFSNRNLDDITIMLKGIREILAIGT